MKFLEKLDILLKINKKNRRELSDESGIPYTTISNWYQRGYENMTISVFRKLCDHFNVTMDSMAYDNQEIVYRSSTPAASPEDNSCVPDLARLNTAGREKVKEYAADLAENENYKKDIESSRKEAM